MANNKVRTLAVLERALACNGEQKTASGAGAACPPSWGAHRVSQQDCSARNCHAPRVADCAGVRSRGARVRRGRLLQVRLGGLFSDCSHANDHQKVRSGGVAQHSARQTALQAPTWAVVREHFRRARRAAPEISTNAQIRAKRDFQCLGGFSNDSSSLVHKRTPRSTSCCACRRPQTYSRLARRRPCIADPPMTLLPAMPEAISMPPPRAGDGCVRGELRRR